MASAVVITPRIEQKKNLEAFFQQLPRLGGLKSANVLSEAQILIQNSNIPDYVFLSDQLEKSERERFILWVKSKKSGAKTIFITICGAENTSSETLADHLAIGSHAILKEPINLQALQDVLGVAKDVKFQGTQTRLKTAAGLFLSSAIDKLTEEQGIKVEPKALRAKVKEAIRDFKQLTGVSLTLEAVRPSEINEGNATRLEKYNGVSRRVKGIYEQRIARLVAKLFERPKD